MQFRLTTTIAVKEATLEKLKRVMKTRHPDSMDQTINSLIESTNDVPMSMFGMDKRKNLTLTIAEHEKFQR